MNLMQEAPNVVSEDGLRMLFAEGHTIDVVCRTAATKTAQNRWSGVWTINCAAPDSDRFRLLVTARNNMAPREFKSVNGLFSFLSSLGITTVSIPLKEGEVAVHKNPEVQS